MLGRLKLWACPHCGRSETLIGHGFVRGYSESCSDSEVRGRRIFCSNRALRSGCGRTFSTSLMTTLRGFVVRTLTLFAYSQAALGGLSRRASWLNGAGSAFSLSSGYRLWRRRDAAQSGLRARLSREQPAPTCAAHEPLAQLIAHFRVVFSEADADCFAALQVRTQSGLLNAG